MNECKVTAEERYLFDLNGFLVFRRLLSPDQVSALNNAINRNHPVRPAGPLKTQFFDDFMLWHEGFRDLLTHPRVYPLLCEWVDQRLRLDQYYGIQMAPGTFGAKLHGGAQDLDDHSEYFMVHDGRISTGITTVQWALSEMLPGQGGLACIPGSHKSSFARPHGYDHTARPVIQIPLEPGDAVLFTGALAHCTLPWQGPHERRAVLFKYAPRNIAWSDSYQRWPDELRKHLGPELQPLLRPPGGAD
ncbi:MAG: phytanoyl-CoA dioxygenase family protein [Pseudonocardiaceae bacterium]